MNNSENRFARFLHAFKNSIRSSSMSIEEQKEAIQRLTNLGDQEVNILLVGGTGVGKSSTVNALFEPDESSASRKECATVGRGARPETQVISKFNISENLIVWDSPGLGESTAKDILHIREINSLIQKTNENNEFLIDLVLVILDGGSRDYDSAFRLLKTIKSQISEHHRILVAINKIDMLAQGEWWDYNQNKPEPNLEAWIDKKIQNTKQRIYDECGLSVTPIAYSAGRSDDGWGYSNSYQISELLTQIISAVPENKRIAILKETRKEVLVKATKKQKKKIESDVLTSIASRVILGIATGGILSGCYITTAVCRYLGKQDDCHILNTFRRYRDEWLQNQPDGIELIEKYYSVAPEMVEWLDGLPNKNEIYFQITEYYIKPCYRLIKHKKFNECKIHYIKMLNFVNSLKEGRPLA